MLNGIKTRVLCLLGFILLVQGTNTYDEGGCKAARTAFLQMRMKFPYNVAYALSPGPICDKGGLYRHVQCDWKFCSCNYIDTGRVMTFKGPNGVTTEMRASKSARVNLEKDLLTKICRPAVDPKQGGGSKDVCIKHPINYPCTPSAKRYIFNGFECRLAKEPGCYGFRRYQDCADQCHAKVYDECSYGLDNGNRKCLNPKQSQRYWFDKGTQKCIQFIYQGCGGNSNNYATEQECQQSCVATTLMFEVDDTSRYQITIPVDVIKSRSYNKYTANTINSDQLDEIRDEYPENINFYGYVNGAQRDRRVKTNADGTVAHYFVDDEARQLREQSSPDVICQMNKKIAPCRAYMMKWYFDSRMGDCSVFPYGGCLPNGNNFKTYGECQRYCSEFLVEEQVTRDSKSESAATGDGDSSSLVVITGN